MSCCTANAWGDLKNPDYKEKGQVERVGDLGHFQLELVSISWVVSHITCYKFKCSHW